MRYIIEETVVSTTSRIHIIEAPNDKAAAILAAGDEPALSEEIHKHDVKDFHDVTKTPVRQIQIERTFTELHRYGGND